ncbi:ATP synthase F1 subunit delta [Tuwongella immobilis]|uniref:ATP synthase subunit delta n=1 Tax=Tuwongella immobilis TaxID=692036 RepID=A0A6C2YQ41_9BACT|nr:ATP synthase F1 subunit delta [Tuwongella immobilis]VIP03467.1 f0f1 atp synthase subunit delta : ATP synthase subunit delta OS=Singulisphaera acidiphila (strain ATCC BAA-1392 / DSM 18658 / VKM B-2454 / MOB10) GN=atpH PE=3 SV=1: OSCP [Tuwongella immobilis]VTS04306.1 f0f1 atp synthase subunit delta : ATP synthase subunit delta OS=Singulisphaera acidiphila (strain ATCC BAA-1392 / DSM 18658 / VKM B-2454 / MOB10) GN=atpH PE=3 SV=1: OSCP [Tuwongella immobilis]
MISTEATRLETVLDQVESSERLARNYAEALYAVAAKANAVDSVGEELAVLVMDVIHQSPDLTALFSSRAISRVEKQSILEKSLTGKASPLLMDFLNVLNMHDRLDSLRGIYFAYRKIHDEQANRNRVRVRSAVELSAEQQDRLRQTLTSLLGKDTILEVTVDPELLGGIVLQLGDQIRDYSVRTRLGNVRTHLLTRSSYVIQSQRNRFSSDS